MDLIGIIGLICVGFLVFGAGVLLGKLSSYERIADLEEYNKSYFDTVIVQRGKIAELEDNLKKTADELEKGKKRWSYFESRFVECNTCDPETKAKCLMYTEGMCDGERCTMLVDIEELIDKACEKELKNEK